MSSRDLNNVNVIASINPVTITVTTTGTGIDLRGYDSAAALVGAGVVPDGTITPKIQESDDDSTYTDVAAADQLGTLAAITAAADENVQRVRYKGSKRYIRVVLTEDVATAGAPVAAYVERGHPHIAQ